MGPEAAISLSFKAAPRNDGLKKRRKAQGTGHKGKDKNKRPHLNPPLRGEDDLGRKANIE